MINHIYKVVETFPLPSILVDVNLNILFINSNALQSMKNTFTKIEGKYIGDFFPEIDLCISNVNKDIETYFKDDNGVNSNCNVKYVSFPYDNIYGIIYLNFKSKSDINQLPVSNINFPGGAFRFVINEKGESYFSYISEYFGKIFGNKLAPFSKDWKSEISILPNVYLNNIFKEIDKFDINNSREFSYSGKLILTDNTEKWVEISAVPMIVDGLIVYDGFILDVTERKIAEIEFTNKQKFNNAILNSIPADIALFDKNHNYIYINSNGVNNSAIKKWLIGKNDFDYCKHKNISTTLAETRRKYFNKAIESKGQVEWLEEFDRNGKIEYLMRKFYPFFIDGKFVNMVGYGIDVTELKNKEEEVIFQNKILKNQNAELEQFNYITSHDLQEPLLSLMSFSDLLLEDYSSSLDDEGKLFLQFINKSAIRMRTLINSLMEYARIDKREVIEEVNCNELLNIVLDDLNTNITKNKAIINFDKLPVIKAYPVILRLLFQNLISNGIKFNRENIIPEINITFEERHSDWLFSVSDNGIGIAKKNLDQVFVIFRRLNNQDTFEGYGAGLAHCKKIVNVHSGEIWVDSIVNKGSVFNFTISKNI